jgi:glutamate---cysteine ligase / carboxylate-amine ligase
VPAAPERPRHLPAWAVWHVDRDRPWRVGVEEEVMLLDAHSMCPANRVDDVLASLPPHVAARASAETHACVTEIKTRPHGTVAGAAAELVLLRSSLAATVRDRLGLRVAAAGTHPSAHREHVALTSAPRYREVAATMRALSRREPTMAQHVHVAVPGPDAAVRALDGLRRDLPLLLALSANSPFWRAADSGFASARTAIFSAFPRTGIPRPFGGYRGYVEAVEPLLRSGAIPEPGFLWWDARLQPRLGTLEVRIMDAQTRAVDAAALTAVVQCLVRLHAEGDGRRTLEPEILAENRFVASRDGMAAALVDERGGRRPMREALAELLARCAPVAHELGCAAQLAAAGWLAGDPGDVRQRACAARAGLAHLIARLADEFAPIPAPRAVEHGALAAAGTAD